MRVAPLVAVCFAALGCRASVQADAAANANLSSDSELDPELEAQLRAERAAQAEAAPPSVPSSVAAVGPSRTLLGARHDLALVPDRATAQCSCLKVALGQASGDAFRWNAGVPALDNETQLVVALSSEGSGCQDPKGTLGASYWGYRRKGADIVVYVEGAVKGRPLTSGAVIPKPLGDGQVFVAPAERGLPYGKASDGKGNCKLGNPGARRTAPATPEETGAEPPN